MIDSAPYITLTSEELRDLSKAKRLLENPGRTARLADLIGSPLERSMKMLPPNWYAIIQKSSQRALMKALKLAVLTVDSTSSDRSSDLIHKIMAGASGGFGGAFGLPSLVLELPVSTTLMLRSIADIARSENQNLHSITTKLACLEVFALGGKTAQDDGVESAYWTVRTALAKSLSDAAFYLANRSVLDETAPVLMRLITSIASRFGVMVSEQIAAKAVPIVGALSGSVINVLFMNHFQSMARGHFIVKRLEDKYGAAHVQEIYLSIPQRISTPTD